MGSEDVSLNSNGIAQATLVKNFFEKNQIKCIVSSPLSRAKLTAEIIAQALTKPIIIINDLKESCWGEKEGKPVNQEILQNWLKGTDYNNAENVLDFDRRVANGLKITLGYGSSVLIVSHSNVYRSIQKILGLPVSTIENGIPICHIPPLQKDEPWSAYKLSEKTSKPKTFSSLS